MSMNFRRCAPLLVGAVVLGSGWSLSSEAASSASSATSQPPGPPPEAIAACQGKSAGSAVSFTGRGGETFSGTCQSVNGALAAQPTGGHGGPGGQTPPAPR